MCGYSQLDLPVNAATENSFMNVVKACYFLLRYYDKLFVRELYHRKLFALWLEVRKIIVLLE